MPGVDIAIHTNFVFQDVFLLFLFGDLHVVAYNQAL